MGEEPSPLPFCLFEVIIRSVPPELRPEASGVRKMKQCPTCEREFKDQLHFCPFHGLELVLLPETDKLIGTVLDNKYRIEIMIGEGGMGRVYRATHIHMDHTVAVKILHSHLSSDQMALERFRREARSAAQLHHPNAVAVSDFGVTMNNNVAYLVMEFLDGLDLRQKIDNQRQLDCEETFSIVQQICAALDAAHSNGIIHRDLKPDNIWLSRSADGAERVKVLDFGIAKIQSTTEMIKLTQQGVIVGTPHYMSPEQCSGEDLDSRSDIYSLGVIIYEMLTGQVPFQASTPVAVAIKHATQRPNPPRRLRADIPIQIEEVVLRALEKKQEDRPSSALELAQEFEMAILAAGMTPRLVGTGRLYAPFIPTPPVSKFREVPAPIAVAEHARAAAVATAPAPLVVEPLPGRAAAAVSGNLEPALQKRRWNTATGKLLFSERMFFPDHPVFGDLFTFVGKHRKTLAVAGAIVIVLVGVVWVITMLSGRNKVLTADPLKGPLAPPGMVLVKAGKFMMGSDDPRSYLNSRPAHPMLVGDFFLDVNEVSNEEYFKFIGRTGHPAPPHWKNGRFRPGTEKLPVINVSWFDARAYASWTQKRLPAEAEWEYAARGTDNKVYPWSDQWKSNYATLKESGRGGPVEVGNPNGRSWCGVNDMVGNVAEWVGNDQWNPYPGSTGTSDAGLRIYRGGSYNNSKDELWTINRSFTSPGQKLSEVGFRCAKDLPR